MAPWVAISIIVVLGVFLIVLLVILHTFGVYVKLLTTAHRETIDLRLNMAKQENDRAALAILHSRRHDDPPLTEEKRA